MADPFSRKLEFAYLDDLEETVADHELVCQILAQDWTATQLDSGIAVPRYLESFEREIDETLGQTSIDLRATHYGNFTSDNHYVIQRGKTSSSMLDESDLNRIRSLYENRDSEEKGIPSIIYIQALLNSIMLDKPDAIMDRIAEVSSWNIPSRDRLIPIMHAAIDTTVYQRARYAPGMEQAKAKLVYASSDAAQGAMNSGLDLRVLRYAKRRKANGEAAPETADFIRQFASTDLAAQALTECIEGTRSMRNHPYSTKGYMPRVTPQSREKLRLTRRLAKLNKQREDKAEAYRKFEHDRDFLRDELVKAAKFAMEFLGYDISEQEIFDHVRSTAFLMIHNRTEDELY